MRKYTVEKGDTLWNIAKRFDISLDDIIEANPQLKDPNMLQAGMVINIPVESCKPSKPSKPGNRPNKGDCIQEWELRLPRPLIYVVKPGDTLYNLATAFNLTVAELLAANPQIKDPDYIVAGEKLFIPNYYGNRYHICPRCGSPFRR